MKTTTWSLVLLTALLAPPLLGQPMRGGLASTTKVSIEPAKDSSEHLLTHGPPGQIRGKAVRVDALLPLAYELPKGRIVVDGELPKGDYDVEVDTVEGNEPYALRHALEMEFGWEVTLEPRAAYALRAMPDRQRPVTTDPPSQRSGSSLSVCRGELVAGALSTQELAAHLSTLLDRPVRDETGLNESYTLDLDWKPRDSEALVAEVKRQVGLELVPADRPMEVVVIHTDPAP